MSWKPEVIADSSGKWSSNLLRFATEAEAAAYVRDLEYRWTAVLDTRVVEVDDPITAEWEAGHVNHLPGVVTSRPPSVTKST
jgi:hypothetical protein